MKISTLRGLSLGMGLMCGTSMVACGQLETPAVEQTADKERWNRTNSPENFRAIDLNYAFDALPSSGSTEHDVWPSTYWATYKDSINVRWKDDEMSPAEKYDVAANGWIPPEGFMEMKPYKNGPNCKDFDKHYYEHLGPLAYHVSANMGNEDARDGFDNDGDGEIDECGDRDGVETWFGLCHAWVPAAMLEDRPLHSIEYNGVVFHAGDLEALVIAAYNKVSADMLGGRCNAKEVKRDDKGRAIETQCRDTNPGAFHVVMANYLGLNKRAFAEDRTIDYEVWNQPIVSYEVHRMDEITPATANSLLEIENESYAYNDDAVTLYDVSVSVKYLAESDASVEPAVSTDFHRTDRYTYILELDADRNIIGGEWYGNSLNHHPDFLWSPRKAIYSSVPHLDLGIVREMIQMARDPNQRYVAPPSGPASADEPAAEPQPADVSNPGE